MFTIIKTNPQVAQQIENQVRAALGIPAGEAAAPEVEEKAEASASKRAR